MYIHKEKTRSFKSQSRGRSAKFEKMSNTPEKSEGNHREIDTEMYRIRFRGKDLETFEPSLYVKGHLTFERKILKYYR